MVTIKKETKRGQGFICAHKLSKFTTIYDAYKKPSAAKCAAYRQCLNKCNDENGRAFRVTGAGTQSFSVAWLTDDGLRVETACNSYLIK